MSEAPVLMVDDDADDREFLQDAWRELDLPYELLFFESGEGVIEYLHSGKKPPFLILCDVNLNGGVDGFKLKQTLLEDTTANYKSIPFVFWSSHASKAQIEKSYDLGGNGFFIKESSFEGLKRSLIEIVQYWRKSKTPY